MDWKIFLASFSSIFIAELADKTQLVGLGLAAKSGKPFLVWCGSVSAYILVTALTVLIGASLGKFIRPEVVRVFGASLFIIIGILMFWGKI